MSEPEIERIEDEWTSETEYESFSYWCYECEKEVAVDCEEMCCSECKSCSVEEMMTTDEVVAYDGDRNRPRHTYCVNEMVLESYRGQLIRVVKWCVRTRQPNADGHWHPLENEEQGVEVKSPDHDEQPVSAQEIFLNIAKNNEAEALENDIDDDCLSVRHIHVGADSVNLIVDGWNCFENIQKRHLEFITMMTEDQSVADHDDDDSDNDQTDLMSSDEDQENSGMRSDIVIVRIISCDHNGHAELQILAEDLVWYKLLKGLRENTIELRWDLLHENENYDDDDDADMLEADLDYLIVPESYDSETDNEILFQQNFIVENDDSNRGPPPASKSAVDDLGVLIVPEDILESGLALCTICKEDFCAGEAAKQLPCLHFFHGDCILPWLCLRNSCPTCRDELPTDDEYYEEQKKNHIIIV